MEWNLVTVVDQIEDLYRAAVRNEKHCLTSLIFPWQASRLTQRSSEGRNGNVFAPRSSVLLFNPSFPSRRLTAHAHCNPYTSQSNVLHNGRGRERPWKPLQTDNKVHIPLIYSLKDFYTGTGVSYCCLWGDFQALFIRLWWQFSQWKALHAFTIYTIHKKIPTLLF
jgi:hypothetical protein